MAPSTAPAWPSSALAKRSSAALVASPLSTKVGRVLDAGRAPVFDFSADGIRRSFADSLERLALDRIDIALLHDPDDHLAEARGALETVRVLAPRVGVGTNVVATALALRRTR